jgi:hypothetical protein
MEGNQTRARLILLAIFEILRESEMRLIVRREGGHAGTAGPRHVHKLVRISRTQGPQQPDIGDRSGGP